ncbi:BACON domain-containing protein [Odoribacter splanchnicus]|uniref:BACON domain-containing protein n=1 Tax=Odoribacter splanchnicus TaxID=28118 RepID=UPI000E57D316|nr:BACON domain-containing protein [Odoribacter splanchnicus]RHD82183.1 hypothetical protein DW778_13455 [Odoribacter splanchnicus]
MKRLFYLLMMLSCTLWSCSKSDGPIDDPDNPDNPDAPTNVMLDISVSDLVFGAEGGEKEFTIYCNSDWTITNESEWCKTTVNQGNGDSKIIVTVGVYSEMEDRNTNLTVKAGNITKVLTVTQKDGDAIILSKDKFDIPEEGGNVTVEVKSNIQYEVSIPSQFQNWIKHEPETKAITVKNFTFTILENKEYEKREGYIVFNGNSLKDTVHIYQTADPRTLILSKDTYNISSAKESIEVELKSNVDYSISIPSSASHWIKLLETKAIRTDKIYFEIEENTTYDNRSAQVFIKDKNSSLCDTLYINQLQQNALILSQKQYEVLAGGEQISIEVQSNIDYEIIIPKTVQEWIEQMPQSKALTKSMINLEIKPNTTYDVRSAQIFIKDKNSTLSDTVQVTQAAKGIYIGDIIFTTEQDLIDFQAAGYTKVRGNVIVSGGEITTLQKLDNLLTEINGSLRLECSTLTTLDGLYGLKTITDSLIIKDGNMTSFEGLRNLETIGGNFRVIAKSSNSSLRSLSSFKGLSSLKSIGGDFEVNAKSSYSSASLDALESFEGLESLEIIGGNFKVIAESSNSSSLRSLSSFKGLSSLKSIGGDFEVNAKSSYSSSSLDALESFEGLESLEIIGGNFKVIAESSNSSSLRSLSSFKGLSGLKSIGGDFEVNAKSFYSSSLDALESFEGLSGLKSIGGDFEVNAKSFSYSSSLDALASFEGLESLETIGGNFKVIGFSLESLSSFKGLSGLKSIGGDFEVGNLNSLESFEGLESLETIGGNFKVIGPSLNFLASFKGLSGLKSIGGDFEVNAKSSYSSFLDALESFEGLESLETIGGNFKVIAESSLFSLNSLASFKGLSGLKSIGGDFEVNAKSSSSLNSLASFEGLENLTNIGGGKLTISNCKSLNNIDILKNIESLNDISITECSKLYDFCVLKNVVQNMSGTFYLNKNGYNPTKYQLLNGECSQIPQE